MDLGVVGSMRELGVTESYKLKRQVVLSASEAAEMILRVDDSKCYMTFIKKFHADHFYRLQSYVVHQGSEKGDIKLINI